MKNGGVCIPWKYLRESVEDRGEKTKKRAREGELIYRKPPAGKYRGPAKPWTMTLWMSMLPPLWGLHSLIRMYLPDLQGSVRKFSARE